MQLLPVPSLWAASLLPAPQPTEGHVGEAIRKNQSCCSCAEKLHFPPCVLGKRPVQPRGCSNCLKQLHYCFLTAGRRQFLCFPLLDSCQHSSTTQSIYFAFTQGMAPTSHGHWLTLATVPRHSKPGRMPPGWQCHRLLFAVGKEQFLHWPCCEMQNLFPAAARAQSGELMMFNLPLRHILQTSHIKTF